MRFAHVLPNKGVNDYAVQVVIKDLERLGHKRIILKNDQEPAVMALRAAVKARSSVEIVPEESPAYESASNGEIKSTIRTIQDQIRTIKDDLECRIGARLGKDENVVTWMVTHAAETTNRYHVLAAKGYTAYERWKGRKFRREMVEFGEYVMFKTPGLKGKEIRSEVARWSVSRRK